MDLAKRTAWIPLLITLLASCPALAATVLVEAEAFDDVGGWVVDQQFMDEMGSPFVLAHGLGVPVKDAATTVKLPALGTYRVWVRTRDWVAHTKAPATAGRFRVAVGGKLLEPIFGTKGAEWAWHDGGTVTTDAKEVTVVLKDLTGFAGRCDAILLSDEKDFRPPGEAKALAAFRKQALGLPAEPASAGGFDLVVVGGGVAGTCAAVSAARLGLSVALIQDRPVLGGNNSSEVRVWRGGGTNLPPWPRIGDVVYEMGKRATGSPGRAPEFGDQIKLKMVEGEKNIKLLLNYHAFAARAKQGRIVSVVARHVIDSTEVRVTGRWFADCTGDGTIGFLVGADFDMTRKGHMGRSNMWRVIETDKPQPFPRCPWAHQMAGRSFPTKLGQLGKWFWESGFDRDPIAEGEHIRDNNFRGMYGVWDELKNVRKLYPNHKLEWAAFIAGKRESRRLIGDVILNKEHVLGGHKFPDGCVPSTWSIDLHLPDKRYAKGFEKDEFLSKASFTRFKTPYWVPYRCLYSRNVANLFMAGRNISVTHEALGTVRVMKTTGMMGEIVGMAAAVCKRRSCEPRNVYEQYLDDLKKLMAEGVGKGPPPPPPPRPRRRSSTRPSGSPPPGPISPRPPPSPSPAASTRRSTP